MEQLCNEEMVERMYKLKKKKILRRNVGKFVIYHKEAVSCYIKDAWYDRTDITKIFALKNMIQQYRVTYDILKNIFIVHHEKNKKSNAHFRIHDIGLRYYEPAEYFTFVITVEDNKKHYGKWKTKAAEMAAELYRIVTYPSVSY